MMGSETEIIGELFYHFLQKIPKESMRENEFVFDSVYSLHYKLCKISLYRVESHINSSEKLKNKKATINPQNNDAKCFQYALTAALNNEQIRSYPERI